jgi:RHS repeat-associated protein
MAQDGILRHVFSIAIVRISQQSGSTAEYFLGDALGSVRQLTDTAGEVTYAASYDPYGVVTQTGGVGQSAYGYTGEQQDASGTVYLRARYYNVNDGRFLTKDPSGAERNLYLYARSNPVNYADPTGLFSRDLIMASAFSSCGSRNNYAFYLECLEATGGHFGYVEALFNAREGDRLETYYFDFLGRIMGKPWWWLSNK